MHFSCYLRQWLLALRTVINKSNSGYLWCTSKKIYCIFLSTNVGVYVQFIMLIQNIIKSNYQLRFFLLSQRVDLDRVDPVFRYCENLPVLGWAGSRPDISRRQCVATNTLYVNWWQEGRCECCQYTIRCCLTCHPPSLKTTLGQSLLGTTAFSSLGHEG